MAHPDNRGFKMAQEDWDEIKRLAHEEGKSIPEFIKVKCLHVENIQAKTKDILDFNADIDIIKKNVRTISEVLYEQNKNNPNGSIDFKTCKDKAVTKTDDERSGDKERE
jgi:hypothetical protein